MMSVRRSMASINARGFIRPSSPASKAGVPGLTGWTASLLRVLNRPAPRLEYGLEVHEQKCFAILCKIIQERKAEGIGMQASSSAKPKPIVAINCRR